MVDNGRKLICNILFIATADFMALIMFQRSKSVKRMAPNRLLTFIWTQRAILLIESVLELLLYVLLSILLWKESKKIVKQMEKSWSDLTMKERLNLVLPITLAIKLIVLWLMLHLYWLVESHKFIATKLYEIQTVIDEGRCDPFCELSM